MFWQIVKGALIRQKSQSRRNEMKSWWKIDGSYPAQINEALIGQKVAAEISLLFRSILDTPNSSINNISKTLNNFNNLY